MEADVNFKQFAYRSSMSVMSKSALNFVNMIFSFVSFDPGENLIPSDMEQMLKSPMIRQKEETQMDKIRKKNIIRVAIVNDKAYFVHENTFYTAALINGEVDRSSASPINAFDISKREMKMLLSILDNMNS